MCMFYNRCMLLKTKWLGLYCWAIPHMSEVGLTRRSGIAETSPEKGVSLVKAPTLS